MDIVGTARPLTEAQWGLWYAQRIDPANPIFNTGQYLELRGALDVAALHWAVDRVGEEAEALSLRFVETDDGPMQVIDPALQPRLIFIDLSDRVDPHGAALAAIDADMRTVIDPLAGPLATQRLYRLAPDHHIWAQRVHHLVNDGYGMSLLTARAAELYAARLAGKDQGGRPFGTLDKIWAEDTAWRASSQWADDAAWWGQAMAGLDDVIGMAPGRAQSASSFHRHARSMSDATRTALVDRAKSLKLGWPDVLSAIVAAYCRRMIPAEEAVVGVPHMGRFGSASARVPAMVMNVLPHRVAPDENLPLDEWLTQVAAELGEARRHGRYRSEQLRRDLGLIGGAKRLYGPLVNVQPYDRPPRFAGLEVALHVTGTGPVEDINFTFRGDASAELTLEVDANPTLYSRAEVEAHAERLALFLNHALHAERLGDVPTATPAEAQRELEAFNNTAHPVPETTLAALIQDAMATHRGREALRFEGQALSYAELDQRTAALAAQLRARGVTTESIVAVALPRSLELLIALVGILRAGGAYLPLDLEHPADRIATILASARPAVVLAFDDPHGLYGERLLPPDQWDSAQSAEPLVLPQPDDAAYVIYTSGSTGDPKGVLVTHRAIVNRLIWMGEHYGIAADDRILQKTPATFDVSVWEFFLPLIRGATLVIAPPGAHRDPGAIAALIRAEAITTLHFVPSMLAAFLDAPESDGLEIRRVFCSGEELPADLRDRFHRRLTAELHNLYGPTEAAVDVSYWPADPSDPSRPVPIGNAVWNTRLVILDDARRPVPPGVTGHLYLGGVQLARGYLGREDLTAERFIPDPFRPGERLYMTGDVARRRDDGAIVFLGRADHQVKIRGLRIELGEIESAVAASGLSAAAAVIARDGRLVAYIVPQGDYTLPALRTALAARLPDYMVPAAVVTLDALPVTTNGKLDRKALPAPSFDGVGGSEPATETGRRLAALFAEVLERDTAIGGSDDFFALGGDSLVAVRLLLRIREEFGSDPGLAALFEHPDVDGLAAAIDSDPVGEDGWLAPLVTVARGDVTLPPLFVIHPAGGLCWGYRTLAQRISPQRPVLGLQAPALDANIAPPESIAAIAADYADRIIASGTSGPIHLAGWSVGGIIAQAIGTELLDRGHKVGLLAMLDAYPSDCWRAEPEPTEVQAVRALLTLAGYDAALYPELQTRDAIVGFLKDGDSPLGNLPPAALDGVVRVVLDTNRLVRGHHHRRYDGVLTHIRAGNDHAERPQLISDTWAPYCAELQAVSVPFLHGQLTGADASAQIAPLLSRWMV